MDVLNTNLPLHLFHQGENFRLYETYGAHSLTLDGVSGYVFRVWAPRAVKVCVIGEFNDWSETSHPMQKMIDGQSWEVFIPNAKQYDAYKYAVTTQDGRVLHKADPLAFHTETPGPSSSNASKLYHFMPYKWHDDAYRKKVQHTNIYASPMNVYEVNLLSWKRKENGEYYTYRELAVELVKYVSNMGYTHVELMPLTEYPFDGSWGYQVSGYFAITSRLGTPADFMHLVDAFHAAGIGVILDWVPAHFPKDSFGLYEFDGEPLYEASQPDRMEHKGWGTRRFDYGRAEILSFLISSAMFFFDKFHVDGLRVDAVASMLYLDYDKEPGEWVPNIYGENKNLEALAFLRRLNEAIFAAFPHALMIAEESTAWPMITKPTNVGGLGFNFKWNMGWMNDVLTYVKTDPLFRRYTHGKLTFPMMYAFSENYVLPISHDEVVHGKCSLINKMPGDYEEKFAGIRSFLGYMMAHPGKKLNFMGTEIGQFKEWNYKEGVEFFLKDYPKHFRLSKMVQALNNLYKTTPALFEIDDSWDGFEWLAADDADRNFIAFKRRDKKGAEVAVLVNFSGEDYKDYTLGMDKGKYRVVFNSNMIRYGGSGAFKKRVLKTKKVYSHGKENSIKFDLPRLTCIYLIKEKND